MSSADLQVAIGDLRNALADELGGNAQVRDCAFEAVAAYDRALAAPAGRGAPSVTARMTLADKAATLALRVESEPHDAGAGVTGHRRIRRSSLIRGMSATSPATATSPGSWTRSIRT